MQFTYTPNNLEHILETMLTYVRDNGQNAPGRDNYFREITNTGLFHDAVGKITKKTDITVTVSKDY